MSVGVAEGVELGPSLGEAVGDELRLGVLEAKLLGAELGVVLG